MGILIDFVKKFSLHIRGAINIGSSTGDELQDYVHVLNVENIVAIEPQAESFKVLQNRYIGSQFNLFNKAVAEFEGSQNLNAYVDASKGSFMNLPDISSLGSMSVLTSRLDRFGLDVSAYNFLSIDINGFEMSALKGAVEFLHHIDYVLIKRDENYVGISPVLAVNEFLLQFKLECVVVENGYYLYVKKDAPQLAYTGNTPNQKINEKLVTTSLFGFVGNQMFQIAHCIAYALKNGYDYLIPDKTTHPEKFPAYFDHFPKLEIDVQKFTPWREEGFEYNDIPAKEGLCMVGHFQSYKYFDQYREQLLKLFSPAFASFEQYKLKNTISVHVRRGDYLNYTDIHPVATEKYLVSAIKHVISTINSHTKPIDILFFSDDISWCKSFIAQHLTTYNPYIKYKFSEGKSPLQDMHEMSRCEHNIICNSTFSWWGAYMNTNPNKIVVCPTEDSWFGPERKDWNVNDLLPKEWHRIAF